MQIMSAQNITVRVGNAVDHLAETTCWFVAGLVLVALIYLLTAPPIILAHVKQTGSGSFPYFYWPILRLIESDFGGPMVWYFNSVWGAGLILFGGDEGPPLYVLATYTVVGMALLSALLLPIWKAWRKKR